MDSEKLLPVPCTIPPVGTLYHANVPALAVAEIVNVPPQVVVGVVDVIVGEGFTVATTAVLPDVQPPFQYRRPCLLSFLRQGYKMGIAADDQPL